MNAARKKPHTSLSVTSNILAIVAYLAVVAALMIIARPIPIVFPILGAILGGVGGFLQHLGLKRDYNRFGAAGSALEIRRRLTETRAGKIYLYYFWGVVVFLVALTFALNQSPITAVAAFIVAYLTFAAVREMVTLRDVFAMQAV